MAEEYTQLIMRRNGFDNLPDVDVPAGFTLRCFQDGDEAAWDYMVGDMCLEGFDKAIRSNRFFKPERVKMICYEGKPVATATAWGDEDGDESLSMLHMVAADPEFRGKGLGFCAVNAAMRHMKAEGKAATYLTTDDFRIPAIKIYLKLGYVPDMAREGHAERWKELYSKLGNINDSNKKQEK